MLDSYCPKCGRQVDSEDSFCRSCGASLRTRPASISEVTAEAATIQQHGAERRQDNSMAIAGVAVFFMGFLVCLWMLPLGLPLLAGGLALWIIGAARRSR